MTLALGILSTANINAQILSGAAAVETVDVIAVASREGVRAQAYADEHGIPKAHGSYEALFADDAVDAVYVSLPNGLHHEWTMRALEAGKHVLCEKPYSRHPAEVEEAFAAADERSLVLMEAFMYRHHPQTLLVAQLVADGAVGPLRTIRATFGFQLTDERNVRLQPGLDGGALMDVGCYCVSGSRLLAGEPERVQAEQVLGETGVDVAFHGILRFANDVVGHVDCSFAMPRFQRIEAVGDDGVLVIQAPFRVDFGGDVLLDRDGSVERVDVPEADSYARQLENLAAAVAGEEAPRLGREDALGQARTIEALYRAAEAGESVSL
jgi:D-xylose 1-dehydrogenase (NADP+, D-xylono-1,5-lactone-forming)